MSELIAIVGESGSGKTTSIRNLDPKETFVITTTGKRPGIKGAKKKFTSFTKDNPMGNFYTTANINNMVTMMKYINIKRPEIKVLIIDD